MKLRQLPKDFKVEELSNIANNISTLTKSNGSHRLYILEKRGMETFALLNHLSATFNIPRNCFCIAGLKDKHAMTRQYMTLPAKFALKDVEEENFSLKFVGFVDKEIKKGDLEGNRFEITVRDIGKGEIDGIYHKAKDIEKFGVPNYFDSQRFGSVINNEFIAKHLILQEYENAVKIYLTEFTRHEPQAVKSEKIQILKNWGNFGQLRIRNRAFFNIISEYNQTKDWAKAYRKIPSGLREIYVSAYQSYLWNECIKQLLRRQIDPKKLYTLDYALGRLMLYKNANEQELARLPATFKTISHRTEPSNLEKEIIAKVLAKEGFEMLQFNIQKKTGNFFMTYDRPVLLKPTNFHISEPEKDDMNDYSKLPRFKMKVSFDIPKGSYATVILKRLFNQ